MYVDHRYPQFGRVRASLSIATYPLQQLVDAPITASRKIVGFCVTQKRLYIENQQLRDEHLQQQGRLQKLTALETENARLLQLLQSGAQIADNMSVANIINVDPDPFTHQVIIDKGSRDQVYQGQPIIDANGIMGTVSTVNEFDSRAILITDASHAVPVEDVRNGLRAIAVGTGSGRLELRHVPNTIDIVEGDLMISSGLGGRFPAGFPVGIVKEVKHESGKPFATIVLIPSAKLDRGRHILLVDNSSQGLEDVADETE